MHKLMIILFSLLSLSCTLNPNIELSKLSTPILFQGNDHTAYRDPAILYHDDTFHLFFTLVEIEADSMIYSYTAHSKSSNLIDWTVPQKISPKDQSLNYSSPGNIIHYGEEWLLCLQTYPRPGHHLSQGTRYGDQTARIFIMRSKDLENWSEAELLQVKGPEVEREDMGRMIDPYLIEDHDEPGKYWCFYKQNGVSSSFTYDFKNWTYVGNTESGENVSILRDGDRFLMMHSPANGLAIKESKNLRDWTDWPELINLGQASWPWAKGRLTAGTFMHAPKTVQGAKFLLFFHGSGPLTEREGDFDRNSSIGIAWSNDLTSWEWPGKQSEHTVQLDQKFNPINPEGNTIASRFNLPEGFERIPQTAESFGSYLRNLPLKPDGAEVLYYNGTTKSNYDIYAAVVDQSIGKRDLHQCADAIMRLKADYHFDRKEYEQIHFNFVNGFRVDYSEWRKGKRIVVEGNKSWWVQRAGASDSPESYWKYLEIIFSYAGTLSLTKELKAVAIEEMQIGDVFIQGGSPGHAIIVVDIIQHMETGEKRFLLAQSYMPAQQLQILQNPNNDDPSPWYSLEFEGDLNTPEWTFGKEDLKRF